MSINKLINNRIVYECISNSGICRVRHLYVAEFQTRHSHASAKQLSNSTILEISKERYWKRVASYGCGDAFPPLCDAS